MEQKSFLIKMIEEEVAMKSHNVLCYSKNYLCEEAKEGQEVEYRNAIREHSMMVDLLFFLKEVEANRIDGKIDSEFIGSIYLRQIDGVR
jgi:hypothetical protein